MKSIKECRTENVAKHLAKIYEYIKPIKSESVPIAEVDITTNSVEINFSKDDPVSHYIVTNMFETVADVYKELNEIRSQTGAEIEVYITEAGIHFDSRKNNWAFSNCVSKTYINKAIDMVKPIQNTIDIAIKKVILNEDSSMCDKTRKMSNWAVTERDLTIFERWLKGDSVRTIAFDEHVSTQRIYQIITNVRLFRGDDIYKDPYDLRYLQSISPRIRNFLVKRGVKNIKELTVWVKHNRLTDIPGVGETIEMKILIQLNDFIRKKHEEEQTKDDDFPMNKPE